MKKVIFSRLYHDIKVKSCVTVSLTQSSFRLMEFFIDFMCLLKCRKHALVELCVFIFAKVENCEVT